MARAQCIVHRGNKILMVKHRQHGQEWWCLPGGGIEPGESPEMAALRELQEECCVIGRLVRETSIVTYTPEDRHYTYLIEIGDQEPRLGYDPEFEAADTILVGMAWLALRELPERDRAFLWAAGLMSVNDFYLELEQWSDDPSYPLKM